jgi:hypothetical protein
MSWPNDPPAPGTQIIFLNPPNTQVGTGTVIAVSKDMGYGDYSVAANCPDGKVNNIIVIKKNGSWYARDWKPYETLDEDGVRKGI